MWRPYCYPPSLENATNYNELWEQHSWVHHHYQGRIYCVTTVPLPSPPLGRGSQNTPVVVEETPLKSGKIWQDRSLRPLRRFKDSLWRFWDPLRRIQWPPSMPFVQRNIVTYRIFAPWTSSWFFFKWFLRSRKKISLFSGPATKGLATKKKKYFIEALKKNYQKNVGTKLAGAGPLKK